MKKEKVSTCQGDIQYYVPEKVNNLTMEQARKYLDSYIKDNGEKLIIDECIGGDHNSFHFLCKSLEAINEDLPGDTDEPVLAVFEDGSVLPLPTS